jgi:transposase-like protein/transcription elongation factor Elf1
VIYPTLDWQQLKYEYLIQHKKLLKPINRRKVSSVPKDLKCPHCNAPSEYLYDNTGKSNQFECKVCHNIFSKEQDYSKTLALRCPYCNSILSLIKKRKNFNIYKCQSKKCSYLQTSLNGLSKEQKTEFKEHPTRFKIHYLYREFTTDFFKVDLHSIPRNASSLAFRKFSPHIMGLALTYLVNCGLSTRKTAHILKEVHDVSISHTQISNYATSVAFCLKPFVDNYDYQPSTTLAADETYTKTKGSKRYVWFVIDAIKKSILGYHVSSNRDVGPCILAMRLAFEKFKVFPGTALKFIADGFNSYQLAKQQFEKHNMNFDVTQVVGLTNDDAVTTEFRWVKQIIERLNRTFKFSYKPTNGYGSDEGHTVHVCLFVAYYNFLRPHKHFSGSVLNHVPELSKCPNMPAKWVTLVQLSQQIILQKQCT